MNSEREVKGLGYQHSREIGSQCIFDRDDVLHQNISRQ
jgi:hypothetical protein